ncbi:MAG: acyl-CoA dehydrogenase [Cytophagales bacterium]|nr:acyl-CoA dehydrogenase [Cytophagales bacterium]
MNTSPTTPTQPPKIQNKGLDKADQLLLKNQVLSDDYKVSANFYKSDKIFRSYLKNEISQQGNAYFQDKLNQQGEESAGRMNELSLLADKNGPELIKRSPLGENINEIRFHPSYHELLKIAVRSEMFRVKWEPGLRKRFLGETHRLGFSAGYLYAMSELGLYCPLCMTDGVARLIDLFGEEEDKERLLKHIYTDDVDELYTGAMYLTEKSGGSDVGANLTKATHLPRHRRGKTGKYYQLNGEKWFCSNANADIIFALARTDENIKGTKGLSIFLVEKYLQNDHPNPIDIIRLKDKLGVRSMASAECLLTDTIGKLVGKEFGGFKIMAEMLNLSRLYNSVAALSGSRRALIEAYQFLCHRHTFGKCALDHALVRVKLTELSSLHIANFYLVWRAIKALDLADSGNQNEAELFRLITPMVKKWSAEKGVYIVRESMELMGGLGYIEDTGMPKIMRDVMVTPIWEGVGNIMVLDMLRAMVKSKGFEMMCSEINQNASLHHEYKKPMLTELDDLIRFAKGFKDMKQDKMEYSAKLFFEKLTNLYQIALLLGALNKESEDWIIPALNYLKEPSTELKTKEPLSTDEVKRLIGWEV